MMLYFRIIGYPYHLGDHLFDIAAYLQRIDYHGSTEPTSATLAQLHQAHLLAVPFENLDIALGRPILLDEAAVLRKVVDLRRGGFCYELNSAFAALLRALGYQVTLFSAGVATKSGGFGLDFDHLALRVDLAEPWLVDVGFGESFRIPLHLNERAPQIQPLGTYRLTDDDQAMILQQQRDTTWEPQYRFTLQPQTIVAYLPMCHYQQTSPNSHFTQQRICTRATSDGRITLSDLRLIITSNGARQERLLADEAEYRAALTTYFGIVL